MKKNMMFLLLAAFAATLVPNLGYAQPQIGDDPDPDCELAFPFEFTCFETGPGIPAWEGNYTWNGQPVPFNGAATDLIAARQCALAKLDEFIFESIVLNRMIPCETVITKELGTVLEEQDFDSGSTGVYFFHWRIEGFVTARQPSSWFEWMNVYMNYLDLLD